MKNQLHPVWQDNDYIAQVVTSRGIGARKLMEIMDNLKSMGFVHSRDINFDHYSKHLDALTQQGLAWRIQEQFENLTDLGVLDISTRGGPVDSPTSRRAFYKRFFIFWRDAVKRLLEESTFTFEDQKYWNYLDIIRESSDEKVQALAGVARYDHLMVDEFQDINPLDMALIKSIADRHRSTLTIVGDDDQAIFEWRGATPEYILHPEHHLDREFVDYQLKINYRSPENIVDHSQELIGNNQNRVAKDVRAADAAGLATIEIVQSDGIQDRLNLVTQLVRNTEYPGQVAVISRLRRQLIPYQVYFASDGAPFNTAVDLDVFNSEAFDNLIELLEIWERSRKLQRIGRVIADALAICDVIRRRPLGKKNRGDLSRYLRSVDPKSVIDAVNSLNLYDGPKLSGKTHSQLHEFGKEFLMSNDVSMVLRCIGQSFDGLQFDRERAEDDVFYTAPPLEQLADICESERYSADDLIGRIDWVKTQVQEYRDIDNESDNSQGSSVLERPLHLMTATRAKGKEFDTVVLLDTTEGVWPYQRANSPREVEAERRLFYVAFTRARRRVVMLSNRDRQPLSRFVEELKLPRSVLDSNSTLDFA